MYYRMLKYLKVLLDTLNLSKSRFYYSKSTQIRKKYTIEIRAEQIFYLKFNFGKSYLKIKTSLFSFAFKSGLKKVLKIKI